VTIDEFAAVTVRVIQRDGVDGYLPTACYPATRRMVVLEGYPEPIVPGQVVRDWAAAGVGGRDAHFVAYKLDQYRVQVELIVGSVSDSRVLDFAP
jgi:hypothetical protein